MDTKLKLTDESTEILQSHFGVVRKLLKKASRVSHNDLLKLLLLATDSEWRVWLTRAYLVGLTTTRGLWKKAADALPNADTIEEQELLSILCLLSTVHHPFSLHFPRTASHILSTLLWLESKFISRGWRHKFFSCHIKHYREVLEKGKQPVLAYKTYVLDEKSFQSCLFEKFFDIICEYFLILSSDEKMMKDPNWTICKQRFDEKAKSQKSKSNRVSKRKSRILYDDSSVIDLSNSSPENLSVVTVTDNSHLTLLEATEGITRGTTGLTSWGASAILAKWILANKSVSTGKNILELGSGIGYMISYLLKSFKQQSEEKESQWSRKPFSPSSVTVNSEEDDKHPGFNSYTGTDCHPHVLDLIYHNLSLMDGNKESSSEWLQSHQQTLGDKMIAEGLSAAWVNPASPWRAPTKSLDINGVETRVVYLDWRNPDISGILDVDIILAADIVYAKPLLQPLANVLRLLLSTGEKKTSRSKEAYIACTRRNTDTLNEFLATLLTNGLTYCIVCETELQPDNALFFFNECTVPIKIYKVTVVGVL